MANYLVTGGCGFIGSHLVDALIAAEHRVLVIDDLSTGSLDNLNPAADLIVGDICDAALVKKSMAGMHGCFHLAAVASVERSVDAWMETHQVNLSGTISIFEAAKDAWKGNPIPVVYASSAAVYGDNASMPLSEKALPRPLTAYGADKLGCELHARVGHLVHQVPSMGMRFFNVYGPRQDPRSPYSGVISIFIDKIANGEPIKIFGDGEQCRDFIYVGDVVRFLIAAMHAAPGCQETLNVCTGRMVSINQLAKVIARLSGRNLVMDPQPPRSGDIRISLGNPERAKRLLGIEAMMDLGAGLKSTICAHTDVAEAA